MKNPLRVFKSGIFGFFHDKIERLVMIRRGINSFKIGQSVEGRDINCYQINNGASKVLFLAVIHGNEIGTRKLSHQLINWLFENKERYSKFTFDIIPCLNLDGYSQALKNPDYFGGGRVGRANSHKVDLNRNFKTPSFTSNAFWTHGKDYSESTKVFAGPYANSEPEIQALTKLIKTKKPMLVFSFHNAGKDVVGNELELAQRFAKLFSLITGYRYLSVSDWKRFGQTGSFYEWCTLNHIPIIEIESENRYGSDWNRQKEAIEKVLEEIANQC
ncbi:MAG: M14 family zinc carboxypeptidase [Candidatus Berkelbacteria bacterium]|nr:M14 family zinc carboxypeptidase [Candidatus Berkelbacteria bacterium]